MVKMCLFQPEFQLKEKFGTLIDGVPNRLKTHLVFVLYKGKGSPVSWLFSSYAGMDCCFTPCPQSLNSLYIAKKGALYQKQDLSCPYLRSFVKKWEQNMKLYFCGTNVLAFQEKKLLSFCQRGPLFWYFLKRKIEPTENHFQVGFFNDLAE